MANNNQIKVTATLDSKSLIAGLKKAGIELDKFDTKAQKAGTGGSKLSMGLGKISSAAGALGLAGAGAAVLAFGKASFDAAAQAERLGLATENLAQGIGTSGDAMVAAITKASGETISKVDAMQAANQSMLFGIVQNEQEMARLTEIAVTLGAAMGQSATKSLNDFSTAISRQSPMILDNLGITLRLEEAHRIYAAQLGKSVEAMTETEKQQAFLNAALQKGQERVDQLGGVVETSASRTETAAAAWSNFTVAFGSVLTSVEGSIGVFDGATAALNRLSEGAEAWNTIITEQAPRIAELQAAIAQTAGSNLAAADSYGEMQAAMDGFQGSNDDLKAGFVATTGTFEDYNAELDRLSNINADAKGSMASFLTILTVSKAEWIALKNAQMQGAIASRAAGVAFGEAARETERAEAAQIKMNEALRLTDQIAAGTVTTYRSLFVATQDLANATADAAAQQGALGGFAMDIAEQAALHTITPEQRQAMAAAKFAETQVDVDINTKSLEDSLKNSMTDLGNTISSVIQPTLGEVFDVDALSGLEGNIDEGARRLGAVFEGALGGSLDENIPAVLEQIADIDLLQPLEDALLSQDPTRIAEAAKTVLTDPFLRAELFDVELIKDKVRAELAEKQALQQLMQTIQEEMMSEGDMPEGEGGIGTNLLGKMLGFGGEGAEGEGAGMGGAFEGLAEAASTTFGETIPTAIEPTTTALMDTQTVVTDMTETNLPNLEDQTVTTVDAMIEKLKELQTNAVTITDAVIAAFDKTIDKAGKLLDKFKDMVTELENIKAAADAAVLALSRLPGGGGGGGGGGGIAELQHGGPLAAGQPAIVGEAGPELFVPRSAGTVVPNGGFGTTVNWNIGSIIINTNNAVQMFEALEREARARGFKFAHAI